VKFFIVIGKIMSIPLRIQYPGAWYHVMNRGRRGGNAQALNQKYRGILRRF
jgi:hypothetical protein